MECHLPCNLQCWNQPSLSQLVPQSPAHWMDPWSDKGAWHVKPTNQGRQTSLSNNYVGGRWTADAGSAALHPSIPLLRLSTTTTTTITVNSPLHSSLCIYTLPSVFLSSHPQYPFYHPFILSSTRNTPRPVPLSVVFAAQRISNLRQTASLNSLKHIPPRALRPRIHGSRRPRYR